jgi:hypothetical protein
MLPFFLLGSCWFICRARFLAWSGIVEFGTTDVCRNKDVDPDVERCLVAQQKLRRASNKGTLRAFRND